MQNKERSSAARPPKGEILHFSLPDLLPRGNVVALNTRLGTLSSLTVDKEHVQMKVQEQFTSTQLYVLLPLLEMYPYYCPYEVLYTSLYHGRVTEESVARSRQHLYQVQEEGLWDREMRPMRDALSRTRLKLHSFGIDILTILATGYLLMKDERSKR